jgi:hypothetical protein
MLLIRSENPRRSQAENPLNLLSENPRPALYAGDSFLWHFDKQMSVTGAAYLFLVVVAFDIVLVRCFRVSNFAFPRDQF